MPESMRAHAREVETVNLEKHRQEIILELEQIKTEAQAKRQRVFNNFWSKMPHDETGFSDDYKMVAMVDCLDRPMHDESEKKPDYGKLFTISELSFQTTWRQFYEKLNEILERLNSQKKIDLDKIKSLVKTYRDHRSSSDGLRAIEELERIMEPIYIELRLLGFSHYDLWQ